MGGKTQTIQATGKVWKLASMLGWLFVAAGALLMLMGSIAEGYDSIAWAGVAALFGGGVVLAVSKFFGWWFHG